MPDPRFVLPPAARGRRLHGAALMLAAMLAGCATPTPPSPEPSAGGQGGWQGPGQGHVPDFARRSFAPFGRADAVAIAQQEWRAFGEPIDDDPPGTRPPPPPELKPERMAGLWQRVGEYWWISQDNGEPEASWTGMHDASGAVFPAREDANYAWSAAFISYVMRIAGAGYRFPYSQSHYDYINIARRASLGEAGNWAIVAERLDSYAPQPGDLICTSRTSRPIRFEDLPTSRPFPAHCDIVVSTGSMLSVIGGNVDDAVTLKHVPVTLDGRLAPPGGPPLDTRYPWFVVLRVLYDQ
jgi:hypothetical protein